MLSSLCLLLLVIATGETMGDSPTANKHRSLQNPPPPPPDNCNTNQDEVIRSDFLVTLFGSPEKLTENEATFIETAIADTYNKLIIAEASCPQGFRNVSTIELRTNLNDFAGAREDLGDRQFDLDFRLVGYCQHCPNAATLFARENQTTAEDGDCACEPPLSDRYVVALQDAVDELRSNRQLRSVLDVVDAAELVPVECELELTNFTTSVLVEFVGASMVTEEDQTLLAAAFSQTYNRINGVNTETCDKYFRQVIAVSASLDTDLGRRRQLLMYDHNGYDNHDNHNHDDSFDVRGRRLDEEDPEVSIRFDILASCRGCNASNTKLFEEESSVAELSRRRLHEIDLDSLDSFMDLMEHTDIRRVLQEDQPPPPSGNPKECRCAENAEDRAISEPEFVTAFNETIAYFTDAAVTVEEAIEIEPFECSSEVTTFNTTTSITITATNVTDAVIQEAGNQFRISYNTLSQRFCDPFFRTIDTVVPIMERRVLSHSRRLTTLVVRYTSSGVCRLCPDETTLFDDATNRRRRRRRRLGLEGEVGVYNGRSGRFLQDTSCFCAAVNVVQGAPTEREFFQRYSDDVQQRRAKGRLEGLESIDSVLEDTTGNRVSTSGDQCTTKQDCTDQNLGTLCVANQCLRRGNPRFTLTWTGDDDLDLKVTTPLGVEIGPNNEYDPMSRGLFNTRFVQTTFRDHVESIYFPRSGTAPSGVYSIEVDVFEVRDTADTWTLNVYGSNNVLEATYTGTGESVGLNYTFDESGRPDDDSCQVGVNNTQCCKDPDCTNTGLGDLCENRACIQKGNPRFTLSYFGDDSLDLIVITPDQEAIYSLNQFDNMSLGMYEPDLNNGTLGFHTQNIYFPRNGSSPNGEYLYFVDLVEQKGDSLDLWTLTFDDPGGNTERTITGAGTSEYFYFSKFPDVLSGQCKVQRDIECCEDNDCSGDEICSTFRCISDGTPRFTLSWLGDDDLDIFVKTPNGTRVDWKTPSDPESGLELEDDIDPESTIVHVENIYFSGSASGDRRLEESQAPVGDYTYGVELWDRRGEQRDEWNLTVSIGGVVVVSHTGRGSNSGFNFDFGVSVLPSLTPSNSPTVSLVGSDTGPSLLPSLNPSSSIRPSVAPSSHTMPSNTPSVEPLRHCSVSMFDPDGDDYCSSTCRPYRYWDYCKAGESFLDLIKARRDMYTTDPSVVRNEGHWYHIIEDKLAAKIFAKEDGIATPALYYCSDDVNDIDNWTAPASVAGFVIKAIGLHSGDGIFVLPNGFDSVELLSGVTMSRQDIKTALLDLNVNRFIIEEHVVGGMDEYKIHMFNGEVGSIIYKTNRGTSCECFAELDEGWNRVDTNGCFRSSGQEEMDGQCSKIDFDNGKVQTMKGLDMCANTPGEPHNLADVLVAAKAISERIGVYMRVDLLVSNDGSVLVGEFTPGHTNGRVHCASREENGCVDSCYLGRMWSDISQGNVLHGGPTTTIPSALANWDDSNWRQICNDFIEQ